MSTDLRSRRRLLGFGALVFAGIGAVTAGAWVWSRQPPPEYQQLEAVVRRLASANDLGQQPLSFAVISGSFTAQMAQQRGLCTKDRCDIFSQLNPYRTYANGWDELIRQGYALGDIEAWASSNGTVMITRPSYRIYGPRTGWLACTVAHEIAHVQRHHIFQQTAYDSRAPKNLPEKDQDERSMAKAREQEMEADRDAADMMARAGFKGRICLDELVFFYKSTGDGRITEKDSSHPGFDERFAALKAHYERREREQAAARTKGGTAAYLLSRPTPGSFRYEQEANLLSFTPRQF